MEPLITALGAVVLLIGLGALLRVTGVFPDAAWVPMDRLSYFVLFPALLFNEIARADLLSGAALGLGSSLVLAQLAMFALAHLLRRPLRLNGPAFTSLVQGVVRWNSYVALALVPLLFGQAAMPLAAIGGGAMTPVANLLSVLVLTRHGGGGGSAALLPALLRNPLILACLGGIAWNLVDLPQPRLLFEPLAILGRAGLALGLLTVGAGLRPVPFGPSLGPLATASLCKLVLMPLLSLGLAFGMGVDGPALGIVALFAAVPTSSSAYILARLMGGDALLMAAIVTVTTVLALVTMPLFLALVG